MKTTGIRPCQWQWQPFFPFFSRLLFLSSFPPRAAPTNGTGSVLCVKKQIHLHSLDLLAGATACASFFVFFFFSILSPFSFFPFSLFLSRP